MVFFRAVEDLSYPPLVPFSPLHLALLFLFCAGSYWVVNAFPQGASDKRQKLSRLFAWILLADQILLYLWQFGSGYFHWDLSLPLYHCRIAIWLLILGVLFHVQAALSVGMYWGLAGALMALLFPDLYKFSFPHYTNVQFFVAHMTMGFLVLNLLSDRSLWINRATTLQVLKLSNLFHLGLLAFNLALRPLYPQINYGYTLAFPDFIPLRLPVFGHFLLFSLLFNSLIFTIGLAYERQKAKHVLAA